MSRFSTFKKLSDLDKEPKQIEVLGETINVKQHIPTMVQQKFIKEVVHTSFLDGGKFSPLLFEVALGVGLTLMYTDIAFSKRELERPLDIYDVLEETGIIKSVIDNIPENDFKLLMDLVDETVEVEIRRSDSFMGMISEFLEVVPVISEAMKEGMEGIDSELLQQVVDSAAQIQNQ